MSVDKPFRNRSAALSDSGWLQVGATGGPTFGTGWAVWSDSLNELVALRKRGVSVRLVGLCRRTSGTGIIALNMPVGSRPSRLTWRTVNCNGAAGICTIATNGDVSVYSPAPVTGQFYSFDITFDTDQP